MKTQTKQKIKLMNNQEPQSQAENQNELLLKINSKIIDGIFQTLAQLPYGQIEPLMTALRNDLAKNNPQ